MTRQGYVLPLDSRLWGITAEEATTLFDWDYDAGRERMLGLYQKGKDRQWDSTRRIDWSQEVDPDNPLGWRRTSTFSGSPKRSHTREP